MNKVKEYRERKGMTQIDLSIELAKVADIKIPTSTISAIENDHTRCWPAWKAALSKALEVPEKDLFPEEN